LIDFFNDIFKNDLHFDYSFHWGVQISGADIAAPFSLLIARRSKEKGTRFA
jgi:hypothetical protein